MAAVPECPGCGEAEALHGAPVGDDIEITCGSCGLTWLRGARRCASCGGDDIVDLPQVMTRRPRGNQVAIVGRRQVPLCRTCDRAAVDSYFATNRPVAENYASVAVLGSIAPEPDGDPARRARTRADRPPRPSGQGVAPAQPSPAAATTPPEHPTVRHGIESALGVTPGLDSLALVLLGRFLGPARRLEDVERDVSPQDLATWFQQTWGGRDGAARDSALNAVTAVFAHWLDAGWIETDASVTLR